MYTRCTHCATWFALSADQLRQGRGAVRCGSCMRSFDALVNLHEALPEDLPANHAPGAADTRLRGTRPADDVPATWPEDVAETHPLLSDDTIRADWPGVDPTDTDAALPGTRRAALSTPDDSGDSGNSGRPRNPHPERAPPGARNDQVLNRANAGPTVPLDEGALELESPSPPDITSEFDGNPQDQTTSDFLSEATEISSPSGPDSPPKPNSTPSTATGHIANQSALETGNDDDPPPEPHRITDSLERGGQNADGEQVVPQILLDDIDRIGRSRRGRRYRWVYATLALAFVATLVAQYTWFLPGDLVKRYPTARPWVQTFCAQTGCSLPQLRQPSLIRLASRDVRIHPKYEGALLVTASLINDAAYAQSFPNVTFTLFNVNGQTIASREFQPADYLEPTTISTAVMPPQQPVQIVLELLAPEEAAVSFEFQFH